MKKCQLSLSHVVCLHFFATLNYINKANTMFALYSLREQANPLDHKGPYFMNVCKKVENGNYEISFVFFYHCLWGVIEQYR